MLDPVNLAKNIADCLPADTKTAQNSSSFVDEKKTIRKKELSSNKNDFNKIEPEQPLFENLIETDSLPLILSLKQVALLFQVSIYTVYRWSSLGRFDNCRCQGSNNCVRLHRDMLLKEFFSGPLLRKDSK